MGSAVVHASKVADLDVNAYETLKDEHAKAMLLIQQFQTSLNDKEKAIQEIQKKLASTEASTTELQKDLARKQDELEQMLKEKADSDAKRDQERDNMRAELELNRNYAGLS